MLFNAEPRDTDFQLPTGPWQVLLDSSDDAVGRHSAVHCIGHYPLRTRSVVLLAGSAPAPTVAPMRPGA